MDYDELKQIKAAAAASLPATAQRVAGKMLDIDTRMAEYVWDVAGDPDGHNVWEILGVARTLRWLTAYYWDTAKVQRVLRAIEGRWEGGRYIEGGLKIDSNRGLRHYALTPMQVYIYACIYGPHRYVDMGEWDGGELLESECLHPETGHVLDLRRVVTEATLFIPRKHGKTDMASNFCVIDFLFGPTNGQSLIVSNTQDQSRLTYVKMREKMEQIDPQRRLFRVTAAQCNWKPGYGRTNEVRALTAGPKSKDGLFASLVVADEYGGAYFVKEKSDMANLVNVARSSMGPRREPLTVITTTAGNNINGPFQLYLNTVKDIFINEITSKKQ